MQGEFEQTLENEQGKLLQKASGSMWLKKPGQFRWEVKGKDPRLVVSDGTQVWDYDKELAQVTVQKFKKGQTSAPIYFLTGEVDSLDKDFKITPIPITEGKCLKDSDTCFELLPMNTEGAFQSIRIGFKRQVLKELQLLDQLGQHSTFTFNKVLVNSDLASNLFSFVAPKGVDVVGE